MSSAASLTTYSSADWKATSILATVFAALFYRNKQQQDLVPSLLTRFPKQQLPSGRRRR
jgi:3-isopropylmalate dehydratase small subunit